jgi:hypothetical protein
MGGGNGGWEGGREWGGGQETGYHIRYKKRGGFRSGTLFVQCTITFAPNKSASYAGTSAKQPPMHEIAKTVLPTKA